MQLSEDYWSLTNSNFTSVDFTSSGFIHLNSNTLHPVFLANIIVGVVGFISNAFTLLVISKLKDFTKNHVGVFIYHQTVVDLVTSSFLLLSLSMDAANVMVGGVMGDIYCRLLKSYSLLWVGLKASTVNLLHLSLERYLQIVFPLLHRLHVSRITVIGLIIWTWIVTCALSTHLFLILFNEHGICRININIVRNKTLEIALSLVEFIVIYLIPLVAMGYFYSHMIYALRRKSSERHHNSPYDNISSTTHSLSHAQINLVKTFFIVALLYMVCWTPSQLYCLIFGLRGILGIEFYSAFRDPVYGTGLVLAMCNVCINPFVYAWKFEAFKTKAREMIVCKGRNSHTIPVSEAETML